jgi:hypothetical protein
MYNSITPLYPRRIHPRRGEPAALCQERLADNVHLRQVGRLLEVRSFASPPRGGFAFSSIVSSMVACGELSHMPSDHYSSANWPLFALNFREPRTGEVPRIRLLRLSEKSG